MRAAVCREFREPLSVEEVELSAPLEDEVSVDLAYCAVCHSDVTSVDGGWGGRLPAVYGHEASGTVSELGAGVEGISLGDRVVVTLLRSCGSCAYCRRDEPVFCNGSFARTTSALTASDGTAIRAGLRCGAFAESVVVHRSQVAVVNDGVPLDAAALLACGVLTGTGAALRTAAVAAGSSVVVVGIGGVGVNVVQGARLRGAGRIIAIDLSREKLELATRFGATHTIEGGNDGLVAAVAELTDGIGADYAFCSVGATAVMAETVSLCRRGGTAVMVGIPPNDSVLSLDAVALPDSGLRLLGSKMGASRLEPDLAELCECYLAGSLLLDELISKRRPLEEVNEALEDVRTGSVLRTVIEL